jgi:exosortase/archaeosortase family protein
MTTVPVFEGRSVLLSGLFALAALNGWAARLLAPNAPAVSLFALVCLWVCLEELWRDTPISPPTAVMVIVAPMIAVPSGAAAWIALIVITAIAVPKPSLRGLLIALAAAELLTTVGMPQIKAHLLPTEAALAGHLLSLADLTPVVSGNVIQLGDRMTVVAAGCSGLPGALFATLGAASVFYWRTGFMPPATRLALLASAGLFAFAVNLVRLALMATSAELYEIAHGQYGALAADLASSAGVLLAVLLTEKLACP